MKRSSTKNSSFLPEEAELPSCMTRMRRFVMPFLALVALLFSNLLMAPDVHADHGERFAHAADHVYAHGAEHFDTEGSDEDRSQQDHEGGQHHNCSFNLSEAGASAGASYLRTDVLKRPLRAPPLASRAPAVPKQPPKA